MSGGKSRIMVHATAGGYRIHVAGRFGGGFAATRPGTPAEVAPFIGAQIMRYTLSNPLGGYLMAPPEIMDLIPEDLRSIEPRVATP